MLFRERIYQKISEGNLLSWKLEPDESYFGGKRKSKRDRNSKNRILERRKKIKVEIVKDVKANTL